MGSTSETYENGTNVVVYVANENAHLQSQQQQRHQYHSHNIGSSSLHAANNNESVYNICPEYGSSAVTVADYEADPVVATPAKSPSSSSPLFDISDQNDSDSCTINGSSMRDNTNFASYNGSESDKLVIGSHNSCYPGSGSVSQPATVATITAPFANEKLDDPSAVNFVATPETSYVRSESVRSVDSATSGCSSLSSSSVGNSKQSVAFPSYRVVPLPDKETSTSSFQKQSVSVPFGWKRLLNNGSIIYISPSSSVLTSLEQVNSYLLTDGNCFCGLDCPLYSHSVFNFDPEVATSTVPAPSGGLQKLCNHKRKRSVQHNVPSTVLPNQTYENIPLQSTSTASRPLLSNYCNPAAVVKKHVFDISDRRKKRKIIPNQLYINDDASVPSPNVMVNNECDISTKENNSSVITTGSQVGSAAYNQQIRMTVDVPEQTLTASLGSTVHIKAPTFSQGFSNQTPYYNSSNQNYNFSSGQSGDSFPLSPHHNRAAPNQHNMFVSHDEFHSNQNNSGYVCNSVKNNVPQQTCHTNTSINQLHHMNCGGMRSQQHRIPCNENNAMSPHHHINSQQQSSHIQRSHLSMVAQQSQFQHQEQHQQHHSNFQQMRVLPNHHHHHQGHHHQLTNNTPMHSVSINSSPVSSQIMMDSKFSKQTPQNGFMNQDKIDKPMYHHGSENEHMSDSNIAPHCMMSKNTGSLCSCYYNDNSHSHPPSQQRLQQQQVQQQHNHNSCMSDCTNNCSSVIVHNAQGQIIMQPGHHMINHDTNKVIQQQQQHQQIVHHQKHHPHIQNQMQPQLQQVYSHHLHHSQQQKQQHHQQQQHQPQLSQQSQVQQMQILQQQQKQQQQHQKQQQHQQMLMMQNQNSCMQQNMDMKSNQSRCNQMMYMQMNNSVNTEEVEIMNRSQQHFVNQGHDGITLTQRSILWQQKSMQHQNALQCSETSSNSPPNPYDRVPMLHSHISPSPNWNDESSRKKFMKSTSKSPTNVTTKKMKVCYGPGNQDARGLCNQISNSVATSVSNVTHTMAKDKHEYSSTPVPSFMEDPSGYLAQQTALLNSTISKQTGENPSPKERGTCYNQNKLAPVVNPPAFLFKNESGGRTYKLEESKNRLPQAKTPDSSMQNDPHFMHHSQAIPQRKNSLPLNSLFSYKMHGRQLQLHQQQYEDSPVTSSTYSERENNTSVSPPESRSPIQAGTVSTSHQSPVQPSMTSPNICGTPNTNSDMLPQSPAVLRVNRENDSPVATRADSPRSACQPAVTAVVSGHTCSSNTITSVLAGKTNTAVVSINNTSSSNSVNTISSGSNVNRSTGGNEDTGRISTGNYPSQIEHQITKSPLEMVQSVVSSIQIPSQSVCSSDTKTSISQNSIQTSHLFMSNSGQLLVATSSTPQSVVSQQNLTKVSSPISVLNNSSVVTNVTGTVTQVIPTVGVTQQVLGQPTVLVNTLPSGQFVFQPSVMALDSAGNAVQLPQLTVATNNVVQGQTITDSAAIPVATGGPFSPRGQAQLLSPDNSKRKVNGKKRKLSPQQMLQVAQHGSQNNVNGGNCIGTASSGTGTIMHSQAHQNFQSSAPMLQTLILPNKNSQFASTQPLIATANVLQPVNVLHNIPTIQQFIVPAGLGGMVMTTGDGTATLLPETVQLNLLTPVQNATGTMFSSATGQGILTANPGTGMVIRTQTANTPAAAVNTQLRPQTISTPNGAQFIATQSPNQFIVNGSGSFTGQLSPIVANVSPNQQIHAFNTSPTGTITGRSTTTATPEYIQCNSVNGQTLMVPCSVSQASTSPQNTTVVQQNTTIVQQQMTMVSNSQQLPETSSHNGVTSANINLGQHNIILNDGKQSQNFIITTADKSTTQPQTSYIVNPKSAGQDKHSGTHIILNNLNSEKQSSSFIISPDKSLCGNFFLANASEKTNARGNFIIAGSQSQNIERQGSRFAKHSVSTQTAAAAASSQQVLQISSTPTLIVATNNTFSQTSSSYSGSPPDTTTHSPIGTSGHSPDTPSSSIVVGSTDDAASPTSSTPVGSDMQRQPMVHCISSSNVADWSDNSVEEKKVNIIVDHGTNEIITGIDMFPSLGSIQSHFQRRTSVDTKENMSYIESSTFDESSLQK